LFLEKGANANFSTFPRSGPALVLAVRNRNSKLIQMLLPRSTRVNSTRALCHAVEQQDISTVTTLLRNGVLSDFENPYPQRASVPVSGCDRILVPLNQGPRLETQDFNPPLVRAIRLGNISMVQLLLANGGDPNAAYHVLDIPDRRKPWEEPMAPIYHCCGRAAQLAKELGHHEIVQLLLDSGADVGLPPPVWAIPDHTCPSIPRSVYLQVMVGLNGMAVAREKIKVVI
jgi:serum/glucocorticoid-regulated kinase 2